MPLTRASQPPQVLDIIPAIPSLEELQVDNGSSETLHHDIAQVINTLSCKVDMLMMNQQFILNQLMAFTHSIVEIKKCTQKTQTLLKHNITTSIDSTQQDIEKINCQLEILSKSIHKDIPRNFNGLPHTTHEQITEVKVLVNASKPTGQPQSNSPPASLWRRRKRDQPMRLRQPASSTTRLPRSVRADLN